MSAIAIVGWKVFCALMMAGSTWFAVVAGRNAWKTVRTGSTRYVDPVSQRVSRDGQPVNFWLFVAFNVLLFAFFASGAAMFALIGIGVIPTTGLDPR